MLVGVDGLGWQAVVGEAQGGGAAGLDEVDLDGRALGWDAHPAVAPAVGEDDAPVRDELEEAADDGRAVRVRPAQLAARHRIGDRHRWLDEAAHPLDATMRRAREIVLGADDRVTESIKWKTPTFAFKGNIASFNPSKNLVSIMFHRGAEIPGDHPRLEGDGKLVRTMRFADLDELEVGRADLEAAVRAWCDWKAG